MIFTLLFNVWLENYENMRFTVFFARKKDEMTLIDRF